MTRYQFDVSLHVRSGEAQPGPAITLAGQSIETLEVPAASQAIPFGVTFEDVSDALSTWPRMFVEPDGAILWTGDDAQGRWQVDGNLYDRAGRLVYVDLAGNSPQGQFDELLAVLGWPATAVMFQLKREGVWLDEAAFRRWAAGELGKGYRP